MTFDEPSDAVTTVGKTDTFEGAIPDEVIIADVAAAATCACIAAITFGSLLLPGGNEKVSDSVTGAETTSEKVTVAPISVGVDEAIETPDVDAIIVGDATNDETAEIA